MMATILKWVGFTSLKAFIGWIATKYIVKPVVSYLGGLFQKAINDPDTETDEDFVKKFEIHAEYVINKRISKIL